MKKERTKTKLKCWLFSENQSFVYGRARGNQSNIYCHSPVARCFSYAIVIYIPYCKAYATRFSSLQHKYKVHDRFSAKLLYYFNMQYKPSGDT